MATDDFVSARLDSKIELRHPMALLAGTMPCPEIEAARVPALAHRDRKGAWSKGLTCSAPLRSWPVPA
jgi:IS5 family transposase